MTTDLRQEEGGEDLFLTTESAEADEVVCLYALEFFYAVGQFFEDFSQVSDERLVSSSGDPLTNFPASFTTGRAPIFSLSMRKAGLSSGSVGFKEVTDSVGQQGLHISGSHHRHHTEAGYPWLSVPREQREPLENDPPTALERRHQRAVPPIPGQP